MKAMILAAGLGTRLYPLTSDRTKPAVPFLNKPIVTFCVEYLKQHGITEMIVNLHHQPESVQQALGDGSQFGVKLTYSHESEILGTAGALDKVRDQLINDDFVVINGKIITDIDLTAAIETHRQRQAIGTLVLRRNPAHERYSIIEVDEAGNLANFAGFPTPKPALAQKLEEEVRALRAARSRGAKETAELPVEPSEPEDETAPLMFASIHVMSPRIFDYIPRGVFSDSVRDVYPAAMAAGHQIATYTGAGSWYEFSTLQRYLDISLEFLRRAGKRNSLGADSVIELGALVSDCVLWERARIEAGATLRRCIIGDEVVIPADTHLEEMVVVRADRVPTVERGVRMGDNLVVSIT